jgi:hypothetical protein
MLKNNTDDLQSISRYQVCEMINVSFDFTVFGQLLVKKNSIGGGKTVHDFFFMEFNLPWLTKTANSDITLQGHVVDHVGDCCNYLR